MKKILIIDDDLLITTVYERFFRTDGFEVRVANGGKAGINAVHDFRPDAVLLDLNMPDVSGIQWLVDVRKDPRYAQLPVVVFTSAAINWQIWAANNSHVSFIFKDSATPKDVVKAVKDALGILEEASVERRSTPEPMDTRPEPARTPGKA